MNRVFVLSSTKKQLMPCTSARARILLRNKKAAIYRAQPFTIILLQRAEGDTQPIEFKADPGSKTTGVALVADFKRGKQVIWAGEITHRGEVIKNSLLQRRGVRKSRRHRKTRYRKPRFDNRRRSEEWLPPSLKSRVDNVYHTVCKLQKLSPIISIAVEEVRFDMQKLHNPEIKGREYQQGTLLGYETREYLLEHWNRACAYCDISNVPLEIEHIIPRSKGGTDSITNLTLACHKCNQAKGSQNIKLFVKDPKRLSKILSHTKQSLKDASAVNSTRKALVRTLQSLGMAVTTWSGGMTKYNRCSQEYPKAHWIDAACVGESGKEVIIPFKLKPLLIQAQGRGSRQMCRVDRFGFPRTSAKANRTVHGFRTGDIVVAEVPKGKKQGRHRGKVAVRSSGSFNIKTVSGTIQGISYKYCKILQRSDGYAYNF